VLEDCIVRKDRLKEPMAETSREQYLAQFQLD
jgi:hypothetical protein